MLTWAGLLSILLLSISTVFSAPSFFLDRSINQTVSVSSSVNYRTETKEYSIYQNNEKNEGGQDASALGRFSASIPGGMINQRYCNGQHTEIFGGILDKNGKPEITLSVDPNFESRMKLNNKVATPLPISPIYDLLVTVTPIINRYCLPEWDSDGKSLGFVRPPNELPYKVYIEADDEILVGPGTLVLLGLNPNVTGANVQEWQYAWRIKGWPNGITENGKLEKLIVLSGAGDPDIKLVVTDSVKDGMSESVGINFDLCTPTAGNGKYRMVNMRGVSLEENVSSFVEEALFIFKHGFKLIDPFKTYIDQFSFYVDLKKVDDLSIPLNEHGVFKYGVFGKSSTCAGDVREYFLHFSNNNMMEGRSFAEQGGSEIYLNLIKPENKKLPLLPKIAVHETGHAFAYLDDEYQEVARKPNLEVNCTLNPETTFRSDIDGKLYGDIDKEGCTCPAAPQCKNYHRPSSISIMNLHYTSDKFNVISCGYIVSMIKGNIIPLKSEAEKYWPECERLDTIKKGEQDNNRTPILVPVNDTDIFGGPSANNPKSFWRRLWDRFI